MKTENTVGVPIQELIKQLQEIEKQNPHIKCVTQDNEYGIGNMQFSIEKVFVENNIKTLKNKENYEYELKMVQEYSVENRMIIWNNLTEKDKKDQAENGMFYSKENFEKACDNIITSAKSTVEEYEKGVDFLVIQYE